MLPSRKRGFLYASPSRIIAMLFAYARGSQRGAPGLIVEFEADGEEWSVDEAFPMALKTRRRVKPESITGMLILSVEDLYERLIGDDEEVREVRGAIRKWLEAGGC